jgi:transketolase C-terminal domain/subunit
MARVGIPDAFIVLGAVATLAERVGLTAANIARQALRVMGATGA